MIPRIYLFFGPDNYSSFLKYRTWLSKFEEKYSLVNRYIIEADELNADQLSQKLGSVLSGISLFSDRTLIVIKRSTDKDQGKSHPLSKIVSQEIIKSAGLLDENITIVIWEPRDIASDHPLWDITSLNLVKTERFTPPSASGIITYIKKQAKELDLDLSDEALHYLGAQFDQANLNLKKKYKGNANIDDRLHTLNATLNTLAILSSGSVSRNLVSKVWKEETVLNVKDITYALERKDFPGAIKALRFLESKNEPDDSYYQFLGMLPWTLSRANLGNGSWDLLADFELLAKQTSVPIQLLTEKFVLGLRDIQRKKDVSMLSERAIRILAYTR